MVNYIRGSKVVEQFSRPINLATLNVGYVHHEAEHRVATTRSPLETKTLTFGAPSIYFTKAVPLFSVLVVGVRTNVVGEETI